MRIAKFWTIFTLATSAVLALTQVPASAQQQQQQQPQNLQRLDEGDSPATNIPPKSNETTITQTQEQGKVNSVQVSKGKNTYYLKPNTPAGSSVPGDAQASGNRGAQWQVMQFNLNRSEEDKRKEAAKKNTLKRVPAEAPPTVR